MGLVGLTIKRNARTCLKVKPPCAFARGILAKVSETEISRVTRSNEEARASYDKMSKWYDMVAGRFEKKFRDVGLQKLRVKQGEIVLEIGQGGGNTQLKLLLIYWKAMYAFSSCNI